MNWVNNRGSSGSQVQRSAFVGGPPPPSKTETMSPTQLEHTQPPSSGPSVAENAEKGKGDQERQQRATESAISSLAGTLRESRSAPFQELNSDAEDDSEYESSEGSRPPTPLSGSQQMGQRVNSMGSTDYQGHPLPQQNPRLDEFVGQGQPAPGPGTPTVPTRPFAVGIGLGSIASHQQRMYRQGSGLGAVYPLQQQPQQQQAGHSRPQSPAVSDGVSSASMGTTPRGVRIRSAKFADGEEQMPSSMPTSARLSTQGDGASSSSSAEAHAGPSYRAADSRALIAMKRQNGQPADSEYFGPLVPTGSSEPGSAPVSGGYVDPQYYYDRFNAAQAMRRQVQQQAIRILVLGAPQTGKSSFVNAYRLAQTHSTNWPAAPTGICGKYGTTSVEMYPSAVTNARMYLIDTPGYAYDHADDAESDDGVFLAQLLAGTDNPFRLVGRSAVRRTELPTDASNAPDHAVLCIRATDLLQDHGRLSLWNRYTVKEDAAKATVAHLATLVEGVREVMKRTPLVAVTHMDAACAPTWAPTCRALLRSVLEKCIPPASVFFVGCPPISSELPVDRAIPKWSIDQLQAMHRQILLDVKWVRQQAADRALDS